MSSWMRFGVLGLVLLAASPLARAQQLHDVDWNTLLPAEAADLRRQMQEVQAGLRALPSDEQRAVRRVARELQVRRLLAQGVVSEDGLRPSQRRIIEESPSASFPQAASLWARIDALKRELGTLQNITNDALDGLRIRMSGYLLPLEVDRGEVSEFLLVPFVGACIHVPPPPPNQIVHVAFADSYSADSIYEPVTVTGTLSTSHGQVDLFLEDGNALIDRGYRLEAEAVEALETE